MTTPDAQSLLWGARPYPSRGRKPSLTVDGIVAAAIALADTEGLPGLSMPRLAGRLGCGVMTLYRYIPGKDELIALMMDTCLGEPPDTAGATDWRSGCREWALELRQVCLDHPWWTDVALHDRVTGPNETAWLEAELRALAPLELDSMVTMNVALAISSYVHGAVQPELRGHSTPRLGFADYPETHNQYRLVADIYFSPGFQSGEGLADFFEFGLERLLDGIRDLRNTDGDGAVAGPHDPPRFPPKSVG